MNVIIDASAAMQVVMISEWTDRIAHLRASTDYFIAPDIYSAEVGNAIWKYYRFSKLGMDASRKFYVLLHELIDVIVPTRMIGTEALEIALTHALTMYDSLYLACALSYRCSLFSIDKKLVEGAVLLGIPVVK